MLQWMTKWPGGSQLQENLGILFAIGGKVREVRPDATAYVHRNANYIFEAEIASEPIDRPEAVQRQRAWQTAYFAAMQPFLLPQSYVNFPDRDQPNWARAYYGDNLPRLSQVKRKYDPADLFRFAQSIPLS
jgi:Berberine and berberine like